MSSGNVADSYVDPRTNSPGVQHEGVSGLDLDQTGEVRVLDGGVDLGTDVTVGKQHVVNLPRRLDRATSPLTTSASQEPQVPSRQWPGTTTPSKSAPTKVLLSSRTTNSTLPWIAIPLSRLVAP
jgi:hypothetical protein